tara:strand:+ start:45 stop:713 length:669 start_codon:yes stop_codon:yes gene_type:complete
VKEIVLDTETTGLSVKDGHRIVEIGCIELDNLIPTKNVFHCYLNPERKVSESALKVHGYTDEFLSSKKKFIDVVDDFLKFIDGKKIIIHNADFDISHLNNELSLINKKIISKENVIDTLEIARNKFPGSGISLDALCKRFRVDNTRRKTHTALLDCELLSKVYINLIDQKEPIFQFKKQNDSRNVNLDNYKNKYSKKIIKISKEELEIHKKFLKEKLKKNFY